MLEVLHGAFVLLCFFTRVKRSEVLVLAGLWIFLARVKAILSRLQLPYYKTPIPPGPANQRQGLSLNLC